MRQQIRAIRKESTMLAMIIIVFAVACTGYLWYVLGEGSPLLAVLGHVNSPVVIIMLAVPVMFAVLLMIAMVFRIAENRRRINRIRYYR